MDDIFTYNPQTLGTKGFIFIGDKLLVYRRDTNTNMYPLLVDLPGGMAEEGETAFEAFRRELQEEFGLDITPDQIRYVAKYPAAQDATKTNYTIAAHFPEGTSDKVMFGDEGTEWMLMSIDDYLAHDDVVPVHKPRLNDYLCSAKHEPLTSIT